MSEKTNQKLVKCGCGGEAHVSDYKTVSGETAFYVSCRVCDTSTRSFLAKDKAITAWNKAMGADHFREVTKMMAPTAEPERKWIPFKFRELTEEEKEWHPDWDYMMDCQLPENEQEILVSDGKYVWFDTFYNDNDGCYLDGDMDLDGIAWMPLPEPWRGE